METLKKGSRGNSVKMLQKALNLYPDGIFGSLTDEAVREFQKANGLIVDGIVGSKTQAKLGVSDSGSLKVSKRNIKEIIVHCTATPEGEDFSMAQIKASHLQRGFSDIGYHYVIYRDGSIHNGRDVNISGAHCTNHNSVSIGVCYVGGCPPRTVKNWDKQGKDTRTAAQKQALLKLLKDLKRLYPTAKIYPHYKFAPKACPAFNAEEEYRSI